MNSNKIQELLTKAKLQVMGLALICEDPKVVKGLGDLSCFLNDINQEITKTTFEHNPNKFHILED